MKQRPPLSESIAFALARMVDDAQTGRRDPSHSDIQFCITTWKLAKGDPASQGQTVGKAKRVRSVLTWAIEHSFENGRGFVDQLVSLTRSCGGFGAGSPNYVGDEAITSLHEAVASEGFVLTSDGDLRPAALDAMSGAELTEALGAYVRRAQKGAEDAALLVGTGKGLLEAISAHVLCECWGQNPAQSNSPTLLGQAFVALELKTPADNPANGEPPRHRLHRALYEAACAVNTLRNKQGTGHGRPWLPSVTSDEARHATQVMGVVGEPLLRTLKQRKGL
jgi:Abortive infection C-terminus